MTIDYDKPIRFRDCLGIECRLLAHDLPGSTPFVVAHHDCSSAAAHSRRWVADAYSPGQFESLFENIPPAPREWWMLFDRGGYPAAICKTYEEATSFLKSPDGHNSLSDHSMIHVREVLP